MRGAARGASKRSQQEGTARGDCKRGRRNLMSEHSANEWLNGGNEMS